MASPKIKCPFCLQKFGCEIYLQDGEVQDLILDCEICCHPIEVHAVWDPDAEKFRLDAQRSSGFD